MGVGEGVGFTCGGGFVGEEADLRLELEGALGGLRDDVGDVGAAPLAHVVAGRGGGGCHWMGWWGVVEEGWGGHVC